MTTQPTNRNTNDALRAAALARAELAKATRLADATLAMLSQYSGTADQETEDGSPSKDASNACSTGLSTGLSTAAEHRRRHRPGRPARLDCDPDLRAFVLARIDHRTFPQLEADIAAAFPPERRIGKSALHQWWTRNCRNPHPE